MIPAANMLLPVKRAREMHMAFKMMDPDPVRYFFITLIYNAYHIVLSIKIIEFESALFTRPPIVCILTGINYAAK